MPVLDTGHLLAFPRDMLYTRGGVEVRRGGRKGEGKELQAGIKGEPCEGGEEKE